MKKLLAFLLLSLVSFCAQSQTPPATVIAPPPNVLAWDFVASDVAKYGVTGFLVQRKAELCATNPPVAAWVSLVTVSTTLRTFTDLTAVAPNSYCYRVSAVNPTAQAISGTADKTDTFPQPPAPTNFKVTMSVDFNPLTGRYELTIAQMDAK